MENKLNWSALRSNRCPKCNRGFVSKHYKQDSLEFVHSCGLVISLEKFKIETGQTDGQVKMPWIRRSE